MSGAEAKRVVPPQKNSLPGRHVRLLLPQRLVLTCCDVETFLLSIKFGTEGVQRSSPLPLPRPSNVQRMDEPPRRMMMMMMMCKGRDECQRAERTLIGEDAHSFSTPPPTASPQRPAGRGGKNDPEQREEGRATIYITKIEAREVGIPYLVLGVFATTPDYQFRMNGGKMRRPPLPLILRRRPHISAESSC
eukprot:gene11971-8244_t